MEEIDRQLPEGEQIFLDHVGHFVADRTAAADALIRAGFAPTPVSVQVNPGADGGFSPSGTGNVTAMLSRGYLEVLFRTADTPLARQLGVALDRYAGVHLAAFSFADAAAAHARLAGAGFPMQPLVAMQRPVETADGPGIAAFTVARVSPGVMPEGRIQLLTHRTEATVWQPRWLDHPNGAMALADVVIAVADPAEAAHRFARFLGRPTAATAHGRRIALDRGGVEIVDRAEFERLVPGVCPPTVPFIGAYGLVVRSLADAERVWGAAGLPFVRSGDATVVPFPDGLGTGAFVAAETAAALPWRL